MVAGAGALVYWLWKNNKAKPQSEGQIDLPEKDKFGVPRVKPLTSFGYDPNRQKEIKTNNTIAGSRRGHPRNW